MANHMMKEAWVGAYRCFIPIQALYDVIATMQPPNGHDVTWYEKLKKDVDELTPEQVIALIPKKAKGGFHKGRKPTIKEYPETQIKSGYGTKNYDMLVLRATAVADDRTATVEFAIIQTDNGIV